MTVEGCSRCGGGTHVDVTFWPFDNPIEMVPNHPEFGHWTHWGTCPTSLDPMLMRVGMQTSFDD